MRLITKSLVRYEGVLDHINPAEATFALRNGTSRDVDGLMLMV
jgi:hypothetical protein